MSGNSKGTSMKRILTFLGMLVLTPITAADEKLKQAILLDYNVHLEALFHDFHRHPELSFREVRTASKIAKELRDVGFDVTEHVGGTGIVAIMKNGAGPTLMVRADMDGLPIKEKSGLPYTSLNTQTNQVGELVPVMHACGHDVHITSLIGTARQMAAQRNNWTGTLMLIGQPAEEIIGGAKAMKADNLWRRFSQPDLALAFHVTSELAAGTIDISEASPYSGADSVEIIIHGVGAHGAAPHAGKDPIVLAAEIVMALQTLVSNTPTKLQWMETVIVDAGNTDITYNIGNNEFYVNDTAVYKLRGTVTFVAPVNNIITLELYVDNTPPLITGDDLNVEHIIEYPNFNATIDFKVTDLESSAKALNPASEAASASQTYSQELAKAATQLEALNANYQKQINANQKADELKQQMESLSANLAALNNVYGGMLNAMSKK